jgi:phage FluMu protein Com
MPTEVRCGNCKAFLAECSWEPVDGEWPCKHCGVTNEFQHSKEPTRFWLPTPRHDPLTTRMRNSLKRFVARLLQGCYRLSLQLASLCRRLLVADTFRT